MLSEPLTGRLARRFEMQLLELCNMHVQPYLRRPRWQAEQEILFLPNVRVRTLELYTRESGELYTRESQIPANDSKLPSVRVAATRMLGKIHGFHFWKPRW